MYMRRRGAIAGSVALAAGMVGVLALTRPMSDLAASEACDPYAHLAEAPSFTLTSADVADGEQLLKPQMGGIFGAGGEDRSPQLAWSGFPRETRSFVVSMFDPDAPTPSGFWHWAVVDIPASVTELPAGAGSAGGRGLPARAVQLPNDARLAQFLGAAPPRGDPPHRYYIVVTAVDVESVGIDKEATPAVLYSTIAGHTLARAKLVPIAAAAESSMATRAR